MKSSKYMLFPETNLVLKGLIYMNDTYVYFSAFQCQEIMKKVCNHVSLKFSTRYIDNSSHFSDH